MASGCIIITIYYLDNHTRIRWVKYGRDDLGELIMDGKIILKWNLKEKGLEDVDWVHLAHYVV